MMSTNDTRLKRLTVNVVPQQPPGKALLIGAIPLDQQEIELDWACILARLDWQVKLMVHGPPQVTLSDDEFSACGELRLLHPSRHSWHRMMSLTNAIRAELAESTVDVIVAFGPQSLVATHSALAGRRRRPHIHYHAHELLVRAPMRSPIARMATALAGRADSYSVPEERRAIASAAAWRASSLPLVVPNYRKSGWPRPRRRTSETIVIVDQAQALAPSLCTIIAEAFPQYRVLVLGHPLAAPSRQNLESLGLVSFASLTRLLVHARVVINPVAESESWNLRWAAPYRAAVATACGAAQILTRLPYTQPFFEAECAVPVPARLTASDLVDAVTEALGAHENLHRGAVSAYTSWCHIDPYIRALPWLV